MADPAPKAADGPLERLARIAEEAERAVLEAQNAGELEELRVRYLGRKSELTQILRGIGELEPAERGPVGSAANSARRALEAELEARDASLSSAALEREL